MSNGNGECNEIKIGLVKRVGSTNGAAYIDHSLAKQKFMEDRGSMF